MPSKTTQENMNQRFWSKVSKAGPDDCWPWNGANTSSDSTHGRGHGRIRYMGKLLMAHHMSWMIAGNVLPENKYLLHTCDNPRCVNPNHLYVGTIQDNTDDMRQRGREKYASIGEDNPSAKITETIVIQILSLYWIDGYSQQAIADHIGIDQTTISRIIRRDTWSFVPFNKPAVKVKRRIKQPILP